MRLLLGDCVERMAELDADSIDAVVCDPPYGLEFMGKEWDRLDGDAWRTGGGFSQPGIGERPTAWVSYGQGDTANATCATCGGRMRGANRCRCETPEWRVKGKPLGEATGDSRQAQGRKMQDWHERWAVEAFRVLKPGGHLLAFGGTRTYHRLAAGVEDAGFEIRDQIAWLYGSGFPKSLDVAKAIDGKLGASGDYGDPKTAAHAGWIERGRMRGEEGHEGYQRPWMDDEDAVDRNAREYLPSSDQAREWKGWGTALKPALEPIVVARKPFSGTVAENVLAHRTGAVNVDGCRVEGARGDGNWAGRDLGDGAWFIADQRDEDPGEAHELGRWPANVILDPEAAQLLDEQTGELRSGDNPTRRGSNKFASTYGDFLGQQECEPARGANAGGASRFFYCAKTSRIERNAGLDGFDAKAILWSSGEQNPGSFQADGTDRTARNPHPTVKPIELMRWLLRLVTPPGGVVLDPFLGSGTTGCAAALEGLDLVGIERDPDYLAIAEARISFWTEHGEEALRRVAERESADRLRQEVADAGQLDLFATGGA